MNIIGSLITLVLYVGVLLVIFLVIRKLVLWYYKIDKIIENQELTNQLLQIIAQNTKQLYTTVKETREEDLPGRRAEETVRAIYENPIMHRRDGRQP